MVAPFALANLPTATQWLYAAPLWLVVLTMLAIVAAPLFAGRRAAISATLAAIGVALSFGAAVWVLGAICAAPLAGETTASGPAALGFGLGSGMIIADSLSIDFAAILMAFVFGILWMWGTQSTEPERNGPEFFILLLGSALGMMLMAGTTNLLMIVLAIEMASLPSYALVGFDKRSHRGAEAALKYSIFGAISAAIMLYGVSLLYGAVGSLDAGTVVAHTMDAWSHGGSAILAVGWVCVLAGVAFKISAVPFHFWCPDAFEGARIEVATWLSVASKSAGLILLLRLMLSVAAAVDAPGLMDRTLPFTWSVGMLACVTCTFANFAAFRQESVRRLLAYSSIAHAGYMMMAATVLIHPALPGANGATAALLAYVLVYLFMNLGAFGVTGLVERATGSDRLSAFTGLARRAPLLTVAMVICLMSLVGLPPFAGFLAKWWVLLALGGQDSILGWILVTVLVLNTLISLFYYARVLVQMTLRDNDAPALEVPVGGTVLATLCAVLLLGMFVVATPAKRLADRLSGHVYRADSRFLSEDLTAEASAAETATAAATETTTATTTATAAPTTMQVDPKKTRSTDG
jgi:NADH-quinone oxidoreductase subunit N